MSDSQATSASTRNSQSFTFTATRQDALSTLNQPAWRWIRMSLLVGGLGWVLHRLLGGDDFLAVILSATSAVVAWYAAIRLLLLETAVRRFWVVWLGLSVVVLVLGGSGEVGLVIAGLMSFTFLLFRKYLVYRHLTSQQRARVFVGGVLVAVVIAVAWDFDANREWTGAVGFLRQVARYALLSLILFWSFSLVTLFFRMRLHFLRLKPKIFITWMFIAAVPMVLLTVFSLVTIWGSLGSTRAHGVYGLLQEWATFADQMPDPDGEFQSYFIHPPPPGSPRLAGQAPAWLPFLENVLNREQAKSEPPSATASVPAVEPGTPTQATPARIDSLTAADAQSDLASNLTADEDQDGESGPWAPTDTTGFFCIGPELWLLSMQGVGTDDLRVIGRRLDRRFLDHLAQLAGTDIRITSTFELGAADEDAEASFQGTRADLTLQKVVIKGRYRPEDPAAADSTLSFWRRPLTFGGAVFKAIRLGRSSFTTESMLLHLKVPPVDLGREFFEGKQVLNQVFLVMLAIIAGLFLILEVGALFFGLRITSGITSAVSVLHQGTRRLGSGELDTRIQIPNEDEFGDLAASFNEMALAVKRGQEEAVARERLERELETAREIQERLLPHEQPTVPGFEITGTSLPSRQVGGDYYDFLAQDSGRFGIAIGDVSGKGIPAALLMSNLQASLQGQVIHPSSVAEVVGRVNDLLVRSTDPHMFATFFYGVLDSRAATFTVTNAGHNPPIVHRHDGQVERLESGGIPLGWLPDQEYGQQTVELAPGDVVVLFTDGITEAEGPASAPGPEPARDAAELGRKKQTPPQYADAQSGKGSGKDSDLEDAEDDLDPEEMENPELMFGEDALLEVIRAHVHKSATGIKDAVLAAVAAHTAGIPQSDDITLVVIKRQEQPEGEVNS